MKILAIRGQNLASLASEFEVDLLAAPLSGDGLFAITGQTGSGKSTLLDAMCLALFDKTPRLSKGGSRIGRDEEDKERQAGSQDPRSVLRRGAGIGYAEVDFQGVDGKVYRARWNVRRARNKPSGRIQSTKMELWDVAEARRLDSDKKKETLALIEARLGLGFNQFRRSVLLPQGEFAAFLKANEDERGALLERMTDTQVYRDISIAAFQRARTEKQNYQRIADKLSVLKLLEPAEQTQLQAEIEAAEAAERAQGAAVQQARAAVDWFARQASLQAAEDLAVEAVQQAEDADMALSPIKEELAAIAAVVSVRPLLDACTRTQQVATAATQLCTELGTQQAEAARHTQRAAEAADAANAALQEALQKEEQMSAVLAQAAALDGQLDGLGREVALALRESQDAAAARSAAEKEANEAEAALSSAVARVKDETDWLAENPDLQELSVGWGRWSQELNRAAVAQAREQAAATAIPTAQARADQAADRVREAGMALATAAEALAPLREKVAAARADLAEEDGAELQHQQRQLYQQSQRIDALQQRRRQLLDLRARQRSLNEAMDNAAREIDVAEQTIQAAADELVRVQWSHEEAARFVEAARSEEAITSRRDSLQDGVPCPLCGATEHPWANVPPTTPSIFQMLLERVKTLQEQQQILAMRQQQARNDIARLTQEQAAAKAQSDVLENQHLELSTEWETLQSGLLVTSVLDAPLLPEGEDTGAVLISLLVETQAALKTVEAHLAARAEWRAELEAAELARDAGLERREAAQERLTAEEQRQKAALHELETLRQQREQAGAERVACEDVLTEPLAPLGDWRAERSADPVRFRERCQTLASRYRSAKAVVDQGASELGELRRALEVAQVRWREREKTDRRLKATSLERAEKLQALEEQRQMLLGGRDTIAVREALRQQIATARQEAEQCANARAQADRKSTELTVRLTSATSDAERQAAEAAQVQADLDAALRDIGVSMEDLQTRLRRPPSWVTEQQEAIQQAAHQLSNARAIHAERRALRQEHDGARPVVDNAAVENAAAAAAALSEAQAAQRAAQEQRYLHQSRLDADAAARTQSADLIAQRDAQRAVMEHWDVMDDLIGSASGKSFRQFAQSLTLDALLTQANQQLQSLSRRYSLMRVPGEDLVLQIVDHFHGDEVRSVNSLSGGESFLVSLALALGLATLSARDTQIGSLFIDEGFGTLDPDMLDVALSSLDALQASGRQVGLISHVPGMAERIGVQIQVVPRGGGRSIIRTIG